MKQKIKIIKRVKEPLYCVTGRNRLTGGREIISSPMTKKDAEAKREQYASKPARSKPYTWCKVEPYAPQIDLFDN